MAGREAGRSRSARRRQGRLREVLQVHDRGQRPRDGRLPLLPPARLQQRARGPARGPKVIMLGSNNYLGLTTHPKVREAGAAAIDKYGTSMTGSRLVNGTMRLHKELEDKLAAYHGKEAGLVFTTGYQVNLATISALLSNKKSVAVIDKDVHASIYDGVRLAQDAGRADGALQAQRSGVARPGPLGAGGQRGRARHHRRRVQRAGRDRQPARHRRGGEEAQGAHHGRRRARARRDRPGRPRHRGALRDRGSGGSDGRDLLQVARVDRRLAGGRAQGARLHPALRVELPLRGERRAALRRRGDGRARGHAGGAVAAGEAARELHVHAHGARRWASSSARPRRR
jgi:hypothetical protein